MKCRILLFFVQLGRHEIEIVTVYSFKDKKLLLGSILFRFILLKP